MSILQQKPCSKCGETKPLDQFYRDRTRSDNREPTCKVCRLAVKQARYMPRPRRPMLLPTHRTCSICGEIKPLDAFIFRADRPFGRGYHCKACGAAQTRDYYADHREARHEYMHGYRQENADQIRAYDREYSKVYRQENADRLRESKRHYGQQNLARERQRARKWQLMNRDLIRQRQAESRERDRDGYRKRGRESQKRHPETARNSARARRARLRAAEGKFTDAEWWHLAAKYDYTCLCCGKRDPELKLVPDHVIPLARGGSNSIENIQPLCDSCNRRKNARTVDYRPQEGDALCSLDMGLI